ncbi:MAG: S-adenosylmethionine decarboxylase [Firmicutes bacterium]|nr:S-adenosylmethionine decarboxylase [Bacillota bacterium]
MKHIMLDAYGADESRLNDVKYINNSLNLIAEKIGVVTVAPPFLLPYYYGLEPEDVGISSFVFLKGGHITIHTFPLRECYFVDMVFDGEFDAEKTRGLFKKAFPFDESKSEFLAEDRDQVKTYERPFNPEEIFGPHIFAKIVAKKEPTLDSIFDFLEALIPELNMTPIIRPYVIKNAITNPTYLSGIVMIAESHISFHYNLTTKIIYFDIFSCKMFDYSKIVKLLSKKLGTVTSYVVIARGSKHKFNKASKGNHHPISGKVKAYNSAWKDNIFK